ncbi:methyl-accepting chemotaxis protein [Leptospira kmetyi]|uniref:Methyl-accepting chemotaxis protein n=1 Tax=Leptospira kmetyi TaxID=408139 RepID=A0AAD0UWE8_9LEPT|nr:methyl-accepting chemotaxis protein [Leptospira kmetyi]AYV57568.1 methyl-accepting chemotaxis protein [Leptospira kmetyi]
MTKKESYRLRWKLTIGLEVMTTILAVPLGVLFIISAGGYDYRKGIGLIIAAIVSLSASYIVHVWRFIFLGKILAILEPSNWQNLNSIDKAETKRKLLNFPIFNTIFYILQWSSGVPFAWKIMDTFFELTLMESIPYAILPVICYPILGVSHFFLTESFLAEVLESEELVKIQLEPKAVKSVSLYFRIVSTIASISILPIIIISYFLVGQVSGWIVLRDITLSLSLTFVFMIITVTVTSFLLASSILRNSKNMISAFSEMSLGELKISIPMISTDELGRSSKVLNDFIARFRTIVKTVAKESDTLLKSSQVLEEKTKDLSIRMQTQAASTEQMSAGIEEISASIRSTYARTDGQTSTIEKATEFLSDLEDKIHNVHSFLIETKEDADRMKKETFIGESAISSTRNAMSDIETSTGRMRDSVNVIYEIADRIGLLSLNAAIEAARAGASGKGFAVVAQEIAKLGELTQENTKRIRETLGEAVNATQSGRNVLGNTENVFTKIGDTAINTSERIHFVSSLSEKQLLASKKVRNAFSDLIHSAEEIRNYAKEQSLTSMEFSRTVVDISESTDFLNGVVTDIDAMVETLAEQAISLKKEVKFFKV